MAFLPAVGLVASIAGTAFSGISAWQQGKYQAQVAKNNADIAKQNAERASDTAQIEQQRSDLEYAQERGKMLAAQSASGLDVLGRTQFMTRDNLDRVRKLEATDIRKQGVAESQKLFQDAANFKAEAGAAKMSGRNALISSAFDIGSLIGNSRSTNSKYSRSKYRAR